MFTVRRQILDRQDTEKEQEVPFAFAERPRDAPCHLKIVPSQF